LKFIIIKKKLKIRRINFHFSTIKLIKTKRFKSKGNMPNTVLFSIFVLICLDNHFAAAIANTLWEDDNMVKHTSNYTNVTVNLSYSICHIIKGDKFVYRPEASRFRQIDYGNNRLQDRYEMTSVDKKNLKYLEQDRIEWIFIPYVTNDSNNSIINSYHIYGSRPIQIGKNPRANQPLCASQNAIGFHRTTRQVYWLADHLAEALKDRRCVWIIEKLNDKDYVFWNHAYNVPMFFSGDELEVDCRHPRKTGVVPLPKFVFNIDCDFKYAKCNPNHDFKKPLKLQ
jgi:hypothetical protein